MASTPHFLLFPFMEQGHMIPMIDLAKLLALHGAIITIFTTPINAARYHSVLSRAIHSGSQIHVVQVPFPGNKVGLPEGCESAELLPSFRSMFTFFRATYLLYDPADELLQQLRPRPTAIISDCCHPWTLRLAHKHNIPRLVFYSLNCFFFLCQQDLGTKETLIRSISDYEFVTLVEEFKFRKAQLPKFNDDFVAFMKESNEADMMSDGVILNVFEELEPKYNAEYKKIFGSPDRVWCVGPLSLCNESKLDRAERGDKASIDEHECTKWLDEQEPCSVVYVSLGSACNLVTAQHIELGLGLEALNKPFIWVIRKGNLTEELLKWLEEYDFEEKIKGRGFLIRGWAPQVLILSHSSIGSFLTHCGWNSSIEGIAAGVPMITWPLFGDQIYNQTLIVEILKIGASVGVEMGMPWGEEEEKGVVVKREKVKEAIEMVMEGENRAEMKQRCKELAEMAKRAVEEGGSSHRNLRLLIQKHQQL
ncbi:UDP-glycosyltransferase 73C3-like [Cucumis melo var. makuwa]|uniref:UDP-glycosyltransferase 73C3-like n=2 Tax=Cucumis melo TaxID=3656 RepID=A0A5A7TRD3_CUCMM|nr:UDP-glycosyltransferase 73C3-like [Cucumis melo var. makuwa]TYK25175.1 UDP-glycosyltransferase 73C3-like [Cucumis melo var. makuwa]